MPSPSDPVAIELGPFEIRWYAIFILLGIFAGIALVNYLANRRGYDGGMFLDMAPWVVILGIIGARIYYVILQWDYFSENPGDIINFQTGGLTIHGAIIAGVLVIWVFARMRGLSLVGVLDFIVPGVALGQAIGRWGNWANQEAFGTPTDVPWAVEISPQNRPAEYMDVATFHPTFLYESVFNLINAVVLAWLVLRAPRFAWMRTGDIAAIYFIAYGIARLFLEAVRTDSLYIGPLPAAYWLSGALIVAGVAIAIFQRTIGQSGVEIKKGEGQHAS